MKSGQMVVSIALGTLSLAANAVTIASSSFSDGTEGWLAINGSAPATFVASGGDPGGYIYGRDVGAGVVWMFSAPSSFLGDLSSALGGTLSFSLATFSNGSPQSASLPDVKFIGPTTSLVAKISSTPGPVWTRYSVTITPGDWRLENMQGAVATQADFVSVLSQVSALRIRGDFTTSTEVTWLDSVVLASPVPEPQGWLLGLAGLGAIATVVRRRT